MSNNKKKRYYKIIPYTICAQYNIHAHHAHTHIFTELVVVVVSGGRLYNRSDTIIFILSSGVSKMLCVRSSWVIFRVVYLVYTYHGLLLLLCHRVYYIKRIQYARLLFFNLIQSYSLCV